MYKLKVLTNNDGWEALYINDFIVAEGQPLEEGRERVLFFIDVAKTYGVPIEDIEFWYWNSSECFEDRFSNYLLSELQIIE